MKPNLFLQKYNIQINNYNYLFLENNDYEINNSKIIGVTGCFGKTSTIYLLQWFLEEQGYKVSSFSSMGTHCPILNIEQDIETLYFSMTNELEVAIRLEGARRNRSDFILFEVNAECADAFYDLDFDLKILTNFNSDFANPHLGAIETEERKIGFFTHCPTLSLFNVSHDDRYDAFTKELDPQLVRIMTWGTSAATWSQLSAVNRFIAKHPNITPSDFLLYPLWSLSDYQHSTVEYILHNEHYVLKTSFAEKIWQDALLAIGALDCLNLFDAQKVQEAFRNITIPGRQEDLQWNNMSILINKHNGLTGLLGNLSLPEYSQMTRHLAEPGFLPQEWNQFNFNEVDKVNILWSIVGTNQYMETRPGFCFLTPFVEYTDEDNYYYNIFAGNLYKWLYNEMPDLELLPDINVEDIVSQGCSSVELIEQIIADLDYTHHHIHEHECPGQDFWYHKDTLLAYFTLHAEVFEQIDNIFRNYNNEKLNTGLDIIYAHLLIIDGKYEESAEPLNEWKSLTPKLNKIYLTTNHFATGYHIFMLNKLAQYVSLDIECEVIYNRKDAIEKMLEDAAKDQQSKQLLAIMGRGNCNLYETSNETLHITDKEIIENYINNLKNI